jgi:hypothetical protein
MNALLKFGEGFLLPTKMKNARSMETYRQITREDRLMKIAYTAGKYRAESMNGVRVNVLRAEAIAMKYWELGYGVICPHKNCYLIDNTKINEALILNADFEMIRRCVDIMVMIPGWKTSDGAKQEHALAKQIGLEIIYEKEEAIAKYLKQYIRGTKSKPKKG